MKCLACSYEYGTEYFVWENIYSLNNSDENKDNFCAKCFVEKFLQAQPYFENIFSNSKTAVPIYQHYMTATIVKLIIEQQKQVNRISDNLVATQSSFPNDATPSRTMILLKEAQNSLELSARLAINDYCRTAISEFRFIFEKYIDFSYLLLSGITYPKGEITFDEWLKNSKFKSTMKYRCEQIDKYLCFQPYNLYHVLSKAIHGEKSFIKMSSYIPGEKIFGDFWIFDFYKWFLLALWVIEFITSLNKLLSKEFSLLSVNFNEIQTVYSETIKKYALELHDFKNEKIFLVEFPNYRSNYWLDIDGNIQHQHKMEVSSKECKKLTDDYIFTFSMIGARIDPEYEKFHKGNTKKA